MRRIALEIVDHLIEIRVEACCQPSLKSTVVFVGLHGHFVGGFGHDSTFRVATCKMAPWLGQWAR